MTTFKYSFMSRFIYRYSNFVANILLGFHALVSFSALWIDWVNVFPLALNLLIIFLLNRFFIKVYRHFPFQIEIDNEKMICSDFFFKKEKIEIKLIDITRVEGGIFSNRPTQPIYVYDDKLNVKIGMFQHISDFNKIITIILGNIKSELYNSLMEGIKNKQSKYAENKKAPK